MEKSTKHFTIAATLGHDDSLEVIGKRYTKGRVSKEVYAAALRAHFDAVSATKSPQREVAVELYSIGFSMLPLSGVARGDKVAK